MIETLIGLAAMVVFSAFRVPIGISMFVVGFVGICVMRSTNTAIASSMAVVFETGMSYTFSVIPLFILMGNLVTRAGLSQELYRAAYAFVGHYRGGMALATILACGGFGSISGSSVATAATMAKVSMPSMRQYGYSDALATGSIAAGGTLGILIPPSIIMVIYGIITETNIGALFAAGLLAGVVAILCYVGAIILYVWMIDPKAGPPGPRLSWAERLDTLRGIGPFCIFAAALVAAVWLDLLPIEIGGLVATAGVVVFALFYRGVMAVIALFLLVMGGIYGGVFTPTEAAGIGAGIALLFAFLRGALTWRILLDVLDESISTTAMFFVIILGASVFANFVNYTSMPTELKDFVTSLDFSPIYVIVAICAIYVVLGTAMEELSMILLTIPMFFPIVVHLGFDPVWFGILIVVVVEIGLISPPVGMNLFVLNSLIKDVDITTIFRGVMPFFFADIIRLGILIAFPAISLWLPQLLFGK